MNDEILNPNEGKGPRRPSRRQAPETLDELFLSGYTVLRFESAQDFHKMVLELNAAWEPVSRAEQLTVFRMAQTAWLLRRVDTMDQAFQESLVFQERQRNPNAHPAAVLTAVCYEHHETVEWLMLQRLQRYRAMHEATLERLTDQLLRVKTQREASELRAARRDMLRAEIRRREAVEAVPCGKETGSFGEIATRRFALPPPSQQPWPEHQESAA